MNGIEPHLLQLLIRRPEHEKRSRAFSSRYSVEETPETTIGPADVKIKHVLRHTFRSRVRSKTPGERTGLRRAFFFQRTCCLSGDRVTRTQLWMGSITRGLFLVFLSKKACNPENDMELYIHILI